MIEVDKVSKRFGQISALKNVSFQAHVEKVSAVLGSSGSGKTTLLRLIAGLERPDQGRILLDGRVVSTSRQIVPPYQRDISMIFQSLSLWPHMTVEEHLEFVLQGSGKGIKHSIETMLKKVRLTEFKARYPHELSGGEGQRLAIARALITQPSYLLMDEPFGQLDFLLKKEMLSLLSELRKDLAMTIVYVTHNIDEASALADDIIMIDKGRIVFHGNKKECFATHPDWFRQELKWE